MLFHTYLASVAVFVAGSAVCGAARSMTWLILSRAVQGVGAGGIGTGAFALIGALVPPRERGRYQGMTASVMAIGTIGGPLLGGFVTGHLGWRWAFVVMFGGGLYLPLFQQTVQNASATGSGLLMVPMLVPIVITSTIAGKVMSATGRYKIFPVLGAAFLTAGAALPATVDAGTSRLFTSSSMVLLGVGLGCLMQMATTIAQNSVELRDMGAAMSSTQLFRTLGGSLAIAAFGSMFTRAVQHHLPGAAGSGTPATLSAVARAAYLDGVAGATRQILLVIAVLCAAAFALALAVEELPLRKAGPSRPATSDEEAPAPAAG